MGKNKLFRYIHRMSEAFGGVVTRVIRYVNTPIAFFALVVVGVCALLLWGNFPPISIYILIGLMILVVLIVTAFLIWKPRGLQFTAQEQMEWRRMELSDSSLGVEYHQGQIKTVDRPKELPYENGKG